jgi:hypothetical protein
MTFKVLCIVGMMLAATAGQVQAAVVSVGEVGNTRASATNVDGYFDLDADANIFNSTVISHVTISAFHDEASDIDWFSFTGQAGQSIMLDIDTDGYGGGFDSTLHLFDENGTLLALNDDSGYDPGSTTDGDFFYNSFIGSYTLTSSGTYYVAVSDYPNFANSVNSVTVFSDLTRPDGSLGGTAVGDAPFGDDSFPGVGGYSGVSGYNLHISNTPEPASLAVWGIGAIGVMYARRKRQQTRMAA